MYEVSGVSSRNGCRNGSRLIFGERQPHTATAYQLLNSRMAVDSAAGAAADKLTPHPPIY